MSGITGLFGGSSAKTDRGNQLAGIQGNWNLFNYGLPMGESGQAAGQSNLTSAADYYRSLLSPGRQQVAQRSAPAINSVNAATTATRNAEGTLGTGRVGGTVAANREAGSQAQSKIDDIINQNLVQGQEQGAKGLTSIGGTELSNALSLLGISEESINAIMNNGTQSRATSQQIHNDALAGYGSAIGTILNYAFLS